MKSCNHDVVFPRNGKKKHETNNHPGEDMPYPLSTNLLIRWDNDVMLYLPISD